MTNFSQLTALVVDDEQIVQDILQGMCHAIGFRDTTVSSTGAEAIQRMQAATFDLVILDIQLGAEDGLKVARLLRARPELEATRILVVTASRDHATIIAAKHAGADDILLKPFTRDVLRERLEKLFPGHV